jgi:hypothetical protein
MNSSVRALIVYNGQLIAGGSFTAIGYDLAAKHIAVWDGSSWQKFQEEPDQTVDALTIYDGKLIVGGEFITVGVTEVHYIASWDGISWQPLGTGMQMWVHALTVYNGQLVAGGDFSGAGNIWAKYIAGWDGTDWHAFGNGMQGDDYWPRVQALTVFNNQLIAGGWFSRAGQINAEGIAIWNGTDWQSMGTEKTGTVNALNVFAGQLIIGGRLFSPDDRIVGYLNRWGWQEQKTGDLNHDGSVGENDFSRFASQWLQGDCESSGFCYEADLNYDRKVNFADFGVFALHWLE